MSLFRNSLCGVALLVLTAQVADAALLSRMGGQAYYDTVLGISWLADANYARTSGHDSDGRMDWVDAQLWVLSLNASHHLGASNWRLPGIRDTGTPGCNFAYSGTDCGYNVQTVGVGGTVFSEMAHLFSVTLGNQPYCDTAGECEVPGWGLVNTGPFVNLDPFFYWSTTTYLSAPTNAWGFFFMLGSQGLDGKIYNRLAWAVSPGDVGNVPVPGVAGLLAAALAGLALRAVRRQQA